MNNQRPDMKWVYCKSNRLKKKTDTSMETKVIVKETSIFDTRIYKKFYPIKTSKEEREFVYSFDYNIYHDWLIHNAMYYNELMKIIRGEIEFDSSTDKINKELLIYNNIHKNQRKRFLRLFLCSIVFLFMLYTYLHKYL